MVVGCRRALGQLFEVPVEARTEGSSLGPSCAGSGEDDEVQCRQRTLLAKGLAGETLELVAIHGSSRGAA
jgi:hypothetical protein